MCGTHSAQKLTAEGSGLVCGAGGGVHGCVCMCVCIVEVGVCAMSPIYCVKDRVLSDYEIFELVLLNTVHTFQAIYTLVTVLLHAGTGPFVEWRSLNTGDDHAQYLNKRILH